MDFRVWQLVLVATVFGLSGCTRSENRVVVYCAQDREFAEDLFASFQSETNLAVSPKFDTEANKSVALAAELEREQDRPRADLHWNNEILATIRLARKGVYEAYRSPEAEPYPDWSRSSDFLWQAFASRARVLIVNTNLVPESERPKSMLELTAVKWNNRVAMAKPQFGTTATQAACLFEVMGSDAAKAYYLGLRNNGVQIVSGNKQVAMGVAEGRFAVGFTDTDDAMIELNAGKPVTIVFPDADGHPDFPRFGTLYIPNTLAVVRGGPNPEGAKRLMDYLLQPKTEARLALAGGFQIPLNPRVTVALPPALRTPTQVKPMRVDFERAADLWDRTQTFLREEFAR